MQSPEMQAAMANPRAMEAIMTIQRGMQQLQQEAPGLVRTSGYVLLWLQSFGLG